MNSLFSKELENLIPQQVKHLELVLSSGCLFHGYLFCGQDNHLKDSLSKELSLILNCETNHATLSKPCGSCTNCRWIEKDTHPEVPILLEPNLEESKKGVVLIKQVEALLKKLQHSSKFYRIILIRFAESEFLPAESANALLKIIEEPPPKTIFIFYAQDLEAVISTIKSRVHTIFFPSKLQVNENETLNELAEEIFTKNISYYDSVQLSKNCNYEILENLKVWCLTKVEQNPNNTNLLAKVRLIDKALRRLKAFCNKNATLEETIYLLSNT